MKNGSRYSWLLFLLLILVFSRNTFAKLSKSDKLRLQIAKETNDTSKIKLLINLAINYFKSDSEHAGCLKEAYDLSRKHNYRYGLAYGQYYEGLLLQGKGRYEEAIDKCKQSIDVLDSMKIIQSIDDPLGRIRYMFNIAGKQQEKFRYYANKLAFYQRNGPTENMADCFHGLAGYYIFYADYDKAIEYYIRAMEVYKSFDLNAYYNEKQVIGGYYLDWGNFNKAEVYLKSALEDRIRMNEEAWSYFNCYQSLGELYYKKHDYRQALQYLIEGKKFCTYPLYQALNMVSCAAVYLQMDFKDSALFYLIHAENIRKNEKFGLVNPNGNLEIDYIFYKYFAATGNDKLALHRLEAALLEVQTIQFIPLVLKYSNELHSFLLKLGDSLQALRYLIQYNAIQDSMNTMNTKARIATFEIEQQQQQKENEIEQLQTQKTSQRNYYLIGVVLLILIVLAFLSRLRYKRKRDKEQLTTDFKKQLAQAETKALRAQMNPHFIFNSLNSINSFVMDQKHEIASDYLIKFSKLIRLILDNSRSETIPLDKELETLQLYVQLESIRFENHFNYVVNIAENTSTGSIMIPPMLLQPFVENAIWHGLMHKRTKGTITVDIRKDNEKFLNISITDDGIGREKASRIEK